jgi:hypothetical protein
LHTQKLQEVFNSFEKSIPREELHALHQVEQQCLRDLEAVVKASTRRAKKQESRKAWMQKFSAKSQHFCATALHYESLFDTLNNQAPEYTSILWASVKLLLLYNANDAKLKTNVTNHLEEIGSLLEQLEAISAIRPVKQIRTAVTKTYEHLMDFLTTALQYYSEGKLGKPNCPFVILPKHHLMTWQNALEGISHAPGNKGSSLYLTR